MFYARFLGSPKVRVQDDGIDVEVVFSVTNDLGEKLLSGHPDLVIKVHMQPVDYPVHPLESQAVRSIQWDARRRAMKVAFALSGRGVQAVHRREAVLVSVGIADSARRADSVYNILKSCADDANDGKSGLVSTVEASLSGVELDDDAVVRRVLLSAPGEPAQHLFLSERIKETMSRHIWDGGLVTMSVVVGTFHFPELPSSKSSCMTKVHSVLTQAGGVNVLELGCGMGVLGVGLGAVHPANNGACTILMTDLAEGEALLNQLTLAKHRLRLRADEHSARNYAQLEYESLPWAQGEKGCFGRKLSTHRWHLIMLSDCTYNPDSIPALVGTLSALHRHNQDFVASSDGDDRRQITTKVFMTTKPRHGDERLVFDLMAAQGWTIADQLDLPLPVLESESEKIEMYLYEKT